MNYPLIKEKFFAWLTISRCYFYPLTFATYSIGALVQNSFIDIHWFEFFLGYTLLLLLSFSVNLINDLVDFDGDRINQNAGLFSGGSGVLVHRKLNPHEVKNMLLICFAAYFFISGFLLITHLSSFVPLLTVILVISILAIGYSLPPFSLNKRGIGEISVIITHAPGPILIGFTLQGGSLTHLEPWLVSMPSGLLVAIGILLVQIPDYQADKLVRKNNLVVRFGISNTLNLVKILLGMSIMVLFALWKNHSLAILVTKLILTAYCLFLLDIMQRWGQAYFCHDKIDAFICLYIPYMAIYLLFILFRASHW